MVLRDRGGSLSIDLCHSQLDHVRLVGMILAKEYKIKWNDIHFVRLLHVLFGLPVTRDTFSHFTMSGFDLKNLQVT